jgi:hypothetical protein
MMTNVQIANHSGDRSNQGELDDPCGQGNQTDQQLTKKALTC